MSTLRKVYKYPGTYLITQIHYFNIVSVKMYKMKKTINLLGFMLVAFLALVGAAYAEPITVEDVKVEEVNGEYVAFVSLLNQNVSTGKFTELYFTVEELGTTSSVVVSVDTQETEVFTYNLAEVVEDYDMLKKGETYRLNVSSDFNSGEVEAFLFGKTTDSSDDGLGVLIEEIELNDIQITNLDNLQVLNGDSLEVQVRFTATESFDDARLRVSVDGYEHGVIDDSTQIFQVSEGNTYVKTLNINLPADMDSQKDYLLRIYGANDLSGVTYKELGLFVDTQRHRVDVLDLVMTPSSGVEPGQNIIANVRLKNRGQKEQDSVKVSVEIPELGITESSYVSNLDNNEAITSDDMLIFVPDSAQAGVHTTYAKLTYTNGYTQTSEAFSLSVLSPQVVPEKNLLVSFRNNIDLEADMPRSFEIVIANPNQESKPISLVAQDNSWAKVDVSPTLNMVQGGSSDTFTVTVTPKKEVSGERNVVLFVKEGTETVNEVTVNTYVEPGKETNWLNVVLAVLLVLLIIILLALVISIARKKGDNERNDDISTNEEYY